jgi:hypothetical protein
MMTFKKITLTGPFTEEDVRLLMAAVRYCEKKQPEKVFTITTEPDEERTVEEAKQFIKDSFPTVKGLPVEVEVFNRE